MKKYLKEYIQENFNSIIMIVLFITIGLVVGILGFYISDEIIKNEIILNVRNTLDIAKNENFECINILLNSFVTNIFIIAIIYFSTITLIPKILINLTSFFKGISIGLYISILFSIFGIYDGIIALFFLIVLPNIIYISAYIYMCNNSIIFHNKVLKHEVKVSIICLECIKLVIALVLIISSIILEQIGVFIVINNYVAL